MASFLLRRLQKNPRPSWVGTRMIQVDSGYSGAGLPARSPASRKPLRNWISP